MFGQFDTSDFDIRISDFVSLRSPDLVWGMLFLRDLRVLFRGELPVSELCAFAGDYSRFWLRLWRVTFSLPLLWREPPPDRGAGLPSKKPRFPAARSSHQAPAASPATRCFSQRPAEGPHDLIAPILRWRALPSITPPSATRSPKVPAAG